MWLFTTVSEGNSTKCNPSDPWAVKVMLVWKMRLRLPPWNLSMNGCFCFQLQEQSISITQPRNTQLNYADTQGPRSQVQGSTGAASWWLRHRQHTWASPCNISLIVYQCQRPSSVSKYIFILNIIFKWPLMKETKVIMTPRISNSHKGSLIWSWLIKEVTLCPICSSIPQTWWNIILV